MKKKENRCALEHKSLITLSLAFLGIIAGESLAAQTSLPSMEPGTTQQVHFLLEEPSISRSALRDIGRFWGQSSGAMVLALVEGTPSSALPWPASAPSELENNADGICILRASRSWWPNDGQTIHLNHVVVPSSTFPAAWSELGGIAEMVLTINGVDHNIEPDVPMALSPLASGVTLTAMELAVVLGNGQSRSGGLVLPTRSTCPQPMPDLPPWPIESAENPWWVGTFFEGTAVTGSALLRLGADGNFDSPVILCDGFDPDLHQHAVAFGHGDQNWETLWDCERSYKVTLDSLHAIGKDVVFLDFADGTQDVHSNAALLQHVIALCNAHKTSPAPLAVIGVSMGGVIARIALKEMEIQGEDHCAGLFVAFDSPMRGAYLPWSMLQAIDFFAGISGEAADLHAALQSTAAQQLLFLTPDGVPNAYAALQVNLMANGLPAKPICGAILNSHPDANFPLNPGPLLQASESLFGWEYAHVQLNPLPGDPDHDESTSDMHVTFDADIPNASWWFGEPLLFSQTSFCSSNAPQIGKWPGSSTAHLDAFESALAAGGIGVSISQSETMFIPAKSALDVPFSGSVSSTPFDWVHTESPAQGSTPHCDLANHHNALMDWIAAATALDHDVYGYNWPMRQMIASSQSSLQSITIGASGSSLVGSSSPPFEVEFSPCTDQLTVDSLMRIGDEQGNHPGILRLHAGQTLIINEGTQLTIGPGSSVIVEPGGQIQAGPGSQLTIQGLLHLQAEGGLALGNLVHIALVGGDGIFQIEGNCQLASAAEVVCSVSQGGQINLSGAVFDIPESATLQVEGSPSNTPHVELSSQETCTFAGGGKVLFSMNHIALAQDSELRFDGVVARFVHSEISGEIDSFPLASSRIITNERMRIHNSAMDHCFITGDFTGQNALTIIHSFFEHVQVEGNSGGANIASSTWEHSHFSWQETEHLVRLQDNEFSHGFDDGLPLISLQYCSNSDLRNNRLMHHREGLRISQGLVKLGCNVLQRLEAALVLLESGYASLNGNNHGGNSFAENDVHIRCTASPIPDLFGGQNEWGTAFQTHFLGSAWAALGPGDLPAPLDASGNAWPNEAGLPVPLMMNSGLVACNPEYAGQSIWVATDDPVSEANCDESGHEPSDHATVKEVDLCMPGRWSPNPAQEVTQFICSDKTMSVVDVVVISPLGSVATKPQFNNNQINTNDLKSGVYTLLTQAETNKTTCSYAQRLVVVSAR